MRYFKKIFFNQEVILIFIILVLSAVIGIINPTFLLPGNLFGLLKTYAFTGIVSIGVFLVLLSGQIDVSFMGVATVSMYLLGSYMLSSFNTNIYVAFIICGVTGIFLGSINFLVIHFFKVPSLIVTLGTLNFFYGLLLLFSNSRDIYDLPDWFKRFANFNLVINEKTGISVFVIMWLILLIVTWLILKYTIIGRGVFAIGGGGINTARQAGFNILKIQLFIYCYSGFLYGIGSVVPAGLINQIVPTSLVGKELPVIAAVVVGGASLTGGSGSLLGVTLGVVLFSLIRNGITLMRVSSYYQDIITGIIILASIITTNFRLRYLTKITTKVDITK